MLRHNLKLRSLLAMAHDLAAIVAAWWLAYLFRFNFDIPPSHLASLKETLPWVISIQVAAFLWFGLYRGIWRYASLPDLRRILLAVLAGAAIVSLGLFLLQLLAGVPRSVLLLDPILLLLIMGGNRLTYRLWKEGCLFRLRDPQGKPVLVLGAGATAVGLVKELARSKEWRVVGLLDDNPQKQRIILHGLPVLGRIDQLPAIAGKLDITHAIIAMPSATYGDRRQTLEICTAAGVKALIMPSYDDLINGKVTLRQIRNVELDDLLGRDPVTLDNDGLHGLLAGKTVLITGSGGSIGSELCRQIAKFKPGRLVLFELNELALYNVEQEFRSSFPDIPMTFLIGDIKHPARLQQVFAQFRPTVVFHAAAYKHVPLMEQENAWQAVQNNVMGTHVLAQTAIEHGVEKFVLISTDKAVNPTNVMGASKRLSEMVCQALQQSVSSSKKNDPSDKEQKTGFVMVRFGNVLGSTGSVIPKFRKQIAHGGPITVTHPEITRYFMSLPEAAQLVLQAGLMGGKNGCGEIFVLDMGEPVKIADLARDLIRLSGLSTEDIKIVYSGLRPGEKLYEELLADEEKTLSTHHAKLRIAQARTVDAQWLAELLAWLDEHPVLSDAEVKQRLAKWVPEYIPSKSTEAE
jgi:FlaA1/EpsC-like NDP-sugar epimerase